MVAERDGPVVLIGGGHAHVEVVRQLNGLPRTRGVVLVSPSRHAPYSGMLPGHIAGQYRFDDLHIDLDALCRRHGTVFIESEATGIDPERRRVRLADGRGIDYGVLSIDIGSAPALPPGISGGLSVKPIAGFAARVPELDARVASQEGRTRLAVVGQGVAGVEVAFALNARFARKVEVTLVGRSSGPIPERSGAAQRIVATAMKKAGIASRNAFEVTSLEDGHLVSRDGGRLATDETIWTTSSGAPRWLRQTGLCLDEAGFIRVDEHLAAHGWPAIFAAGDVASLPDPRPKAGVFAVRQGPVLSENIRRAVDGRPLLPYRPQRAWLALISLADGTAIADKWGMAVSGRWVSRWKHWNDTRFVQRYSQSSAARRTDQ